MNQPENTTDPTADTNQRSTSEASPGLIDRLRTASQSKVQATEPVTSAPDDVPSDEDATVDSAYAETAQPNPDQTHAEGGSTEILPHEARRALVSLMRYGTVLAHSKKHIFDILCQHQQAIRRHLSEVYLQLVLDERAGVAFIAGIDAEHDHKVSTPIDENVVDLTEEDDIETVSLIMRRTLSLYDTLLLLVLRKHFQEREVSGEQKIMIDIERLESMMTPFLPLTNSERADRKKLQATIKRMVDKRLLAKIRGSEDRYEITPIIRYVVKAEFLETMLLEYHRMAAELGLTLDRNETSGASADTVSLKGKPGEL